MRAPIILVLLALSTGIAAAQMPGVSARAWTDSTQWSVGDPITIHIEVLHPRNASLQPPAGDSLGPLVVLDHLPITAVSETVATTGLVVAYYDSGQIAVPSVLVPYALPGDSAGRTAATNGLLLHVHTVAVDTSKEYHDLKPPMDIPMPLWQILLYVLGGLALVAAGYYGYRYWQRRKSRPKAKEIPAAPARPAHLLALEELGAVREKKLWQRGLVKEYYSEVTEVLRRYFERRYEVRALEETTDEILSALRTTPMKSDLLEPVGRVLQRADLVKFAKAVPDAGEHEETLALAFTIVQQTTPPVIPAAPASPSAHVGS